MLSRTITSFLIVLMFWWICDCSIFTCVSDWLRFLISDWLMRRKKIYDPMFFLLWLPVSLIFLLQNDSNPVDTRRRFNVNKTSVTSCRRWNVVVCLLGRQGASLLAFISKTNNKLHECHAGLDFMNNLNWIFLQSMTNSTLCQGISRNLNF